LLRTVGELCPQVVVVLGKRLKEHLPELPAGVSACGVRPPPGASSVLARPSQPSGRRCWRPEGLSRREFGTLCRPPK
jgi:hypothetical protein